MHTVERITRTNLTTLHYELTVDDPGAYTRPWNGELNLVWEDNTELFEYVCQEQNYAHELMVGSGDEGRSAAVRCNQVPSRPSSDYRLLTAVHLQLYSRILSAMHNRTFLSVAVAVFLMADPGWGSLRATGAAGQAQPPQGRPNRRGARIRRRSRRQPRIRTSDWCPAGREARPRVDAALAADAPRHRRSRRRAWLRVACS